MESILIDGDKMIAYRLSVEPGLTQGYLRRCSRIDPTLVMHWSRRDPVRKIQEERRWVVSLTVRRRYEKAEDKTQGDLQGR